MLITIKWVRLKRKFDNLRICTDISATCGQISLTEFVWQFQLVNDRKRNTAKFVIIAI